MSAPASTLANVQRALLRAVAPLARTGSRLSLLSLRVLCSMPVLNLRQTAADLGASYWAVHDNIESLVRRGLVHCLGRIGGGSGRAKRYALTPKGEALFSHLLPRQPANEAPTRNQPPGT